MKFKISGMSALCGVAWAFVSTSVVAQTNVSGPINSPATWNIAGSPYVIGEGAVTVNSTLTIDPGVVIQFAGPHTLTINGTLIARGTAEQRIVFSAPGNSIVAGKIQFENLSTDATFDNTGAYASGSILEYAVVEKIGGVLTNGAIGLSDAHPYIHNCIIRNNGASGIRVNAQRLSGSLRIEGNVIEGNNAESGGGLYLLSTATSSIVLADNMVINNTVTGQSGGMYLEVDGNATLSRNTFDNNQAETNGGGAMLVGSGGATVNLSSNKFINNHSTTSAGGLSLRDLTATLNSETISGNSSALGGGLMLTGTQTSLTNSVVIGNEATYANGGGIVIFGGNTTIANTVVALNRAPRYHGGGVDIHNATAVVSIDRSIFASNLADEYGAGIGFSDGNSTVKNSAFVFNEISSAVGVEAGATVQSSTFAYNSNTGPNTKYPGSTVGVKVSAVNPSIGGPSAANGNNFIGNGPQYDIFSNFSGTVPVEWNWWGGATNATEIEARLKKADGSSATFDFDPFSTQIHVDNPIIPPTGVTVTSNADSFLVSWNANPEPDVIRYKVYWSTKPFPEFENSSVLITGTQYEVPVLPGGNYNFAVTAIDNDYANANDSATPVNEDQTSGHESWYSRVISKSVVEADLLIEVSAITNIAADINSLRSGDAMYYHVTVTNLGPSDAASDMEITLNVAEGVALTGCGVTTGRTVTCTRAPLKLNEKISIDIYGTVGAINANILATATVSSPDDPSSENNQASTAICVNCPDLVTTWKKAPTLGGTGLVTDYTVSVKNRGRVTANDVALDISIPTELTVSGIPSSCAAAASGVTCTFASLAAGAEQDVTFAVVSAAAGPVNLSAEAATAEIESNTPNNIAGISTNFTAIADLAVTLDENGTTAAAKQTYAITVANNGPAAANDIVVKITVPNGLVATPAGQCTEQVSNTVNCAMGNLGVGASATLSFTAVFSVAGAFEFTASAGAAEFDPDMANNTDKITTAVDAAGLDPPSSGGGGGALNMGLLAILAFMNLLRIRRSNTGH